MHHPHQRNLQKLLAHGLHQELVLQLLQKLQVHYWLKPRLLGVQVPHPHQKNLQKLLAHGLHQGLALQVLQKLQVHWLKPRLLGVQVPHPPQKNLQKLLAHGLHQGLVLQVLQKLQVHYWLNQGCWECRCPTPLRRTCRSCYPMGCIKSWFYRCFRKCRFTG